MASHTDDRWTQGTPNPDMEIFVGAGEFIDIANHATWASAGEGLYTLNMGAAVASTFFVDVNSILRRTGVYMTPSLAQMQFGTAASVPGPTAVANTSSPYGMPVGMPPYTAAQMPTLHGPTNGPLPKGIQVNSMDVVYTVTGAALTLAQCSLTKTKFVNNTAPAVTNLIALAANGMATAVQAQPYVINVAVGTPAMIIDSVAEIIAHVNLTTQAGGSALFYGVNLHCSYNFN